MTIDEGFPVRIEVDHVFHLWWCHWYSVLRRIHSSRRFPNKSITWVYLQFQLGSSLLGFITIHFEGECNSADAGTYASRLNKFKSTKQKHGTATDIGLKYCFGKPCAKGICQPFGIFGQTQRVPLVAWSLEAGVVTKCGEGGHFAYAELSKMIGEEDLEKPELPASWWLTTAA